MEELTLEQGTAGGAVAFAYALGFEAGVRGWVAAGNARRLARAARRRGQRATCAYWLGYVRAHRRFR